MHIILYIMRANTSISWYAQIAETFNPLEAIITRTPAVAHRLVNSRASKKPVAYGSEISRRIFVNLCLHRPTYLLKTHIS